MRYLWIGLIAAACLVAPSTAGAALMKAPNGHRYGVMLRQGVKAPGTSGGPSTGGGVLQWNGGPVLTAEKPYVIYWTPTGHTITSANEDLINQYLTDTAHDSGSTNNVYSVLGQYGSAYDQTFSSSWTQAITATDSYGSQSGCKLAAGMTACVTDASIQTEISSLIDATTLPTPGVPGVGTTPVFFVITPDNVNVCFSKNTCSSNYFCAYHSYFTSNGHDVLYASLPFSVFANGNTKGCQTDGYPIYETPTGTDGLEAYNIADDLSHEFSETITDPLVNAWMSKSGLEVGDLCEAYASRVNTHRGLSPLAYAPAFGDPTTGTLYDQVINSDQYYNQTEFSNDANQCLPGLTALSASSPLA